MPLVALGTVEFDQGCFASAIAEYRKALQLNASSAFAYAHLGEAQLFAADREEARASLQTAIKLDPQGANGTFARSLLTIMDMVPQAKEKAADQGAESTEKTPSSAVGHRL